MDICNPFNIGDRVYAFVIMWTNDDNLIISELFPNGKVVDITDEHTPTGELSSRRLKLRGMDSMTNKPMELSFPENEEYTPQVVYDEDNNTAHMVACFGREDIKVMEAVRDYWDIEYNKSRASAVLLRKLIKTHSKFLKWREKHERKYHQQEIIPRNPPSDEEIVQEIYYEQEHDRGDKLSAIMLGTLLFAAVLVGIILAICL